MFYESFTAERFFTEITTESEARTLLWRSRFQGKEFQCPTGQAEAFYGSSRIYGSILPPSNFGHMEFLGHGVASCERSFLCSCTIVSCPLPTDQGAMTPGRGSMRCGSDLKIQDDAIRSKGEATSPTRSAINLCAPDRIVLPEP